VTEAEWIEAEAQADRDIASGNVKIFDNFDEFIESLQLLIEIPSFRRDFCKYELTARGNRRRTR